MAQGQRNKKRPAGATAGRNRSARQSGQKSRLPFLLLVAAIVLAGAGGILYKMQSSPAPIVLATGAALPNAEGYLLGDPNAPVTIIEFADFECPQCANFATVTEPDVRKRIIEPGLANFRFYDFPFEDMHPNTLFASLAAACAADQGKFWEMHDVLLAGQLDWEGRMHSNPVPVFKRYATQLGLDEKKFETCFDSRENVPRILAHQKVGLDLQVQATPSFVIDGKLYSGSMSYDRIRQAVDNAIAKKAALADSAKTAVKKP